MEALCYLWIHNCQVSLVSWEHLVPLEAVGNGGPRGEASVLNALCSV